MNLVVDIETDSLDATKIHCIVARNMESNENYAFVGKDCYDKFPAFINKHADKIIMLHEGRVEEIGNHNELMDLKGRYYTLFRQQERDI